MEYDVGASERTLFKVFGGAVVAIAALITIAVLHCQYTRAGVLRSCLDAGNDPDACHELQEGT